MTRPNWNAYFLAIAETVAQRADCTRSKVGAVLVNARNEIRGTGYNGSPAGLPGCLSDGACPRGKHYPMEPAVDTVFRYCRCGYDWPCSKASEPDSDYSNCIADHAERNALRHSRPEDLKGATLYVTRPPCPGCTTLITACGIERRLNGDSIVKRVLAVRAIIRGVEHLAHHRRKDRTVLIPGIRHIGQPARRIEQFPVRAP